LYPGAAGPAFNEDQLRELRAECRRLALTNEYAINGHENRISYVVGTGHTYHVAICKGVEAAPEFAQQAEMFLDEFRKVNRWQSRQQEIVRRLDRDGEAFLRFFVDRRGMTHVRFIEPEQIATPTDLRERSEASFGILTDPLDVETIRGYFVDGKLIDAAEIQHRKANVDANVKRGLPLYAPVRKNLRRAEKLLRNMSVVTEIQSAIALIRKHRSASRTGVETFVAANADPARLGPQGRVGQLTQYGPGTILDAPAGLEYDFPATGVNASSFVAILQAELRSIAARLVMPEFMFTSDASNSNYASTMIAEGPAVKMFERLQASTVERDLEIMWRVLENAVAAGKLPPTTCDVIEIQATPPSVSVRDHFRDAQVAQIAYRHGVLSPQTWSRQLGLDYE
ncbi:MAG: phage portal protein, partial [Planctomycetales bacterium]|nr:phage portal protein [Planctomycetales bacterium]